MDNDDIILSPRQKLACSISAGALLVALGIFLLLVGVGVFPFGLRLALIPASLVTVGLIFIVAGIIQDNVVALWLGCFILAASTVSIFAPLAYTVRRGYSILYPLYIAAPGIACLVTMIYSREFKDHIKAIIFFFVLSGFFFLNSAFGVPWVIVLPLMLASFGIFIIVVAVIVRNRIKGNVEN